MIPNHYSENWFKVSFAPNAVTSSITSFHLWFVLLVRDMMPSNSTLVEYSSSISEVMGVNPTEYPNFFPGFSQGSWSTCNFKDHSLISSINIITSAYSGFLLFHTCKTHFRSRTQFFNKFPTPTPTPLVYRVVYYESLSTMSSPMSIEILRMCTGDLVGVFFN